MSRYLTPAKICLLALVDIYVSGAVPNDATVPVLHFVASHTIDGVEPDGGTQSARRDSAASTPHATERWQKAESVTSVVESIDDFERLLSPYGAAIALPGRRLWDVFLKKLWRIDSLDALHRFFDDELPRLFALTREERREAAEHGREVPPEDAMRLVRNSPLGSCVRRAHLEFARLSFAKTTDLWCAFVKYRQPTTSYWKKRNTGIDGLAFDSVLLSGQHDWGQNVYDMVHVVYGSLDLATSQPAVSTDDIESLIEFQVHRMQRYGGRLPPAIRDHYATLIETEVTVPSLSHYVKFLEAWRSGDYPTSFDLLHQYFDYTMQNRDRLFYQYALLNLAILQADFGCHKEAVSTMLETVSTARENRDNSCLNYALNWLYQFGKAHPNFVSDLENGSMLGLGKETLLFLRVKAKEAGSWSLCSSALLSEAKLILNNGESIARASELITRSSCIVVEHNLQSSMGSQLALSIALWDRLGLTPLSRMICEVFLRAHARTATFEDELKISCRLAGILAGRGRYDEAMTLLEAVDRDALRAWKAGQYWHRFRALVKLRRELHRKDLGATDQLLSQLLQARPEDVEPDMVFIIDSLHVEALVRRGELNAALDKVNAQIESYRDSSKDVSLRLRLLLAKASLYDKAGMPHRGFSLAVRAASAAWRSRLLPPLWLALGTLANILVALGESSEAARLLREVIPRALECDATFMAGTLYSVYGDAHMGMAGKLSEQAMPLAKNKSAGAQRMLELMTQAVDAFEDAYEHFTAVEDVEKQCEARAKQAAIMRIMGDAERAEDYAAKYLALKGSVLPGSA